MSYRARKLVSVAEGPMYGPGEEIGDFDPKHPDNAALLDAGAVAEVERAKTPEKPAAKSEPSEEKSK